MNNNLIKLNDETLSPCIGFGTYPLNKKELINTSKKALKYGYKLFDTATAYGNEKSLARGLYNNPFNLFKKRDRKKIKITTKLWLWHCRNNQEINCLRNSLKAMNTDYIDIWLMHWADPETFIKNWKEMEKAKKDGLVKTIGVSNFEIHHLERLLDKCEIIPAINQVECHPLLTQKPLIQYCKKQNIHIQAYSPLGRGDGSLLNNPLLIEIANKYNKKTSQIILKWNIQQTRSVIVKTSSEERLRDNIDLFDFILSNDELDKIDALNQNHRFRYHPDVYPLEN